YVRLLINFFLFVAVVPVIFLFAALMNDILVEVVLLVILFVVVHFLTPPITSLYETENVNVVSGYYEGQCLNCLIDHHYLSVYAHSFFLVSIMFVAFSHMLFAVR